MRIVIDGRMIGWTGIGRYTRRLLEHLPVIDQANSYTVILQPKDAAKWTPDERIKLVELDAEPYSLAEQLKLPRLLSSLQPDLVHFPHFTVPLAYRGNYVVTIHDLTLLKYRNIQGTGLAVPKYLVKDAAMRLIIRLAAMRSRLVLADTVYVADELARKYWLKPDRLAVAPLAGDELTASPEPIDKFNAGPQFLLYVGNLYPYKNVGSTLEALKLLGGRYPKLKLVVAGKADYWQGQLVAEAERLGVSDRVVFTGFVTDGELVSLYRQAQLYVAASLSEGFGLQGLEAMALGLPVLSADASCLPEVYGDAAVYFDPHNAKDQAEKISDLLENPKIRERLRRAGAERVHQYSWRYTAELTLAAYEAAGKATRRA